ncbi:hypothetical protein AAFF_G00318820 [Aldrovandia affinis]|uniref:Uncharacterized protein n=1 Tax=Aldrovandia affinis TaxID=143900 RepID=A0AAD7SMQ0_9TELE|nr:hypothetical protein AAFF_G00318820 [Aldrovandia affinis]
MESEEKEADRAITPEYTCHRPPTSGITNGLVWGIIYGPSRWTLGEDGVALQPPAACGLKYSQRCISTVPRSDWIGHVRDRAATDTDHGIVSRRLGASERT